MGKANVDPTALRQFSKDLTRFNTELQTLMAGLHSKMSQLEATWRDQEQKKFSEAFASTAKVLAGFCESSQQHASALAKKAALIEEYLKAR